MKKTVILTILDGLGLRDEEMGNAFALANTKTLDFLMQKYPWTALKASGEDVGLPEKQMGNSEVGHMNIGAGRVVLQPLLLINNQISDGQFFENEKLKAAINHAKKKQSKLHIMGLLSDGGVHSHIDHFFALLELCRKENFTNVFWHVITDGRDTLPKSSLSYVEKLDKVIQKNQIGKIASIMGRYYAMDRDRRWERTKKAYDVLIGNSESVEEDIYRVIKNNYANDITDEFIKPTLLDAKGVVRDGDSIIFANFRTERATQLLTAISNSKFSEFDAKALLNVNLVSLMPCDKKVCGEGAFHLEKIANTLGEYFSFLNYKQLRIAETEKYAHVTFFFDGGRELELSGCDKKLIPSPAVATYDLQPEMSAYIVKDKVIDYLNRGEYDLIVLNFANPDMVGHTGNLKAAIKAIEAVDQCVGEIYDVCQKNDQLLLLTADHGNAEEMLEEDNVLTSHTTNPVPFVICSQQYQVQKGKLADIAPTILDIMNIKKPKEMTGCSLLVKND